VKRRGLQVFLVVSVGLLALALLWRRIANYDLFWHLAVGRWMVLHGGIVREEAFTFTMAGTEWVHAFSLADLLLYGLYAMGGPALLIAFKSALVLGALALGLRRNQNWVHLAAVFALILLTAEFRLLVRPALFSLFFFSLSLRLARDRKEIPLALVPALWANFHGAFIVGVGVAGFYFAHMALAERSRRRRALLLGATSAFGPILNPFGIFIYGASFSTLANPLVHQIAEWQSPFAMIAKGHFPPWLFFYLALAVLTGFALWWHRRKIPLTLILAVAGAFFLSTTAIRHVALFAFSTPFVLLPFLEARAQVQPRLERALGVGVGCFILLMANLAFSGHLHRWSNALFEGGSGLVTGRHPVGAVHFLEAQNDQGRVLNDYGSGGLLALRRMDAQKIFIYGNNLRPDLDALYLELLKKPQAILPRLSAEMDLSWALVAHSQPNAMRLFAHLWESPQWTLVFVDEVAAVFKKGGGTGLSLADLPKKPRQRRDPTPYEKLHGVLPFLLDPVRIPFSEMNLSGLHTALGDRAGGVALLEEVVQEHPGFVGARLNLAISLFQMGHLDRALAAADGGLQIDDGIGLLHITRGRILAAQGKKDEARTALLEGLKHHPSHAGAQALLDTLGN
jgi:hypothetical protein